jgi:serine/threonine-protein kinase
MIDSIAQLTAALADRYVIDREIGAGGMATVYLARDLKHDRPVALKVLNPELGAILGIERFLAEIRVTANLQHPNLLPLFDSGEAAGLLFYVMPYVEGESLRVRLDREKQFPVEDAVRISVAVANALDYAHAHGVIHRDLKPENILLQSGQPMIADFGIALAVSKAGGNRITQTGLSLGTPQYMSPEQATGDRVIDGRSDIYSLAAVTYEMLTGEPPHIGNTAQAIIARVLTDRPRPIRATRSAVPENVEETLARALEKLPADRFGTAHEFAASLEGRSPTSGTRAAASAPAPRRPSRMRDPVVLALGAALVIALGAAGFALRPGGSPGSPLRPVRFVVFAGDSVHPVSGFPWPAAISPDGGTIVFSALRPPKDQMFYVLRTDQLEAQPVPGTEGAFQPIFSPDGQWLEFEVTGKERKVRLDGSAPVNISGGGAANGADWTSRNELILGSQGSMSGLSRVNAAGGELSVLTHPDSAHGEFNHLWPIAFPSGKTVAFVLWYGELSASQLALVSVDDGKVAHLGLKGVRPLGVLDDRLVYLQADGAVMAVAIDERGKRAVGNPVPVHDPVTVLSGNNGNSDVFLSKGGALIIARGADMGELGWFDRDRTFHAITKDPRPFAEPRISPDGKKIAVLIQAGQQIDLWIDDLPTSTLSRITSMGSVSCAEWRPDGKDLFIVNARSEFYLQAAQGGTPPRPVGKMSDLATCGTMSPDGRSMVVEALIQNTWDLWTVSRDSGVASKAYVTSPATDWGGRFSPDGKWIVFSSDETASHEVYVRSFPDPSAKVQISAGGGATPTWSRDGKRITYAVGDAIVRARTAGPPSFQVLSRDTLLASGAGLGFGAGAANYDLSADGNRILGIRPLRRGLQLIAAPNWIVEYRERIAAAGKN